MKLAVLIVGEQNSGKTSTIKYLINTYDHKSLSIMKAGWQSIFLNSIFKSLKLNFFCVPASPTETGIDLSERFKDWGWIPEVIIVAEQLNGSKYSNTIDFLKVNNYHVIRFDIDNKGGVQDWQRFDKTNEVLKLKNRANQII